jgi:hypothetical protein
MMQVAENGLAGCPFCGTHCSFQRVPFDGTAHAGGHFVECDNRQCRASSVLLLRIEPEPAMERLRNLWNSRVASDAGLSRLLAYVSMLERNAANGAPTAGDAIVLRGRPAGQGPARPAVLITYDDIRAACGMEPVGMRAAP